MDLDLNILPSGRNGHAERTWFARRQQIRSASEARMTLPPCDTTTEHKVLRMMVHSDEQADAIAKLIEREDFYCEEFARLFVEWNKVRKEPKTSERRKAVGRLLMERQVEKAKAGADKMPTIEEACWALRDLRRQRRIAVAVEAICLAQESPDWEQVVQRELEAVRAVRKVEA